MDFHYYDLNSASRLYREEAFGEARKRHLLERARASRDPLGGARRSGLSSILEEPAGAVARSGVLGK